jgi:hypothetical protein
MSTIRWLVIQNENPSPAKNELQLIVALNQGEPSEWDQREKFYT